MSIELVKEFHKKFDLPDGTQGAPRDLTKHEPMDFRLRFLREEVEEFAEALEEGKTVEAFDALIDLVYVAYGTALMMGVTTDQWEMGFRLVHRANMRKVRAKSAAESKRSSAYDVVKPPGWEAPNGALAEILSLTL